MRLLSLVQRFALSAAAAAVLAFTAPANAQTASFEAWMQALKQEARGAGISQATIDTALTGVEPIQRVTELDRKQPEFTQTFWDYLDKRVTPQRVARARKLLAANRDLLARIEARYGVQPRFLVSFWGLESNFGSHTGGFSVIQALVTLAFDDRRAKFFRAQLLDALRIIDKGHISADAMQGSWAGAMGQVQFIPSTFVRYAVDFDGDGRKDLWNSLPDVFASAANFLRGIGWRGDETWGREVRLPEGFDFDLADLKTRKPIGAWQALGVRRADGGDLPAADLKASIILPAGHKGPVFMVYNNFQSILRWNRSILYAIAVGHLADRIAGSPTLTAARSTAVKPLRRTDVEVMQTLLASLGFDAGKPDGVVGAKTRAALKGFQRKTGLAADGFPTYEILEALRKSASGAANTD
jgi:peptidoglycan lytic transglycosylase B